MEIDKIYITFERNSIAKLKIYEMDKEGKVYHKKGKIIHVAISSRPEWQQYVKDTSLQIYPKLGNILEIPTKLKNLRRLAEPKQQES